MSTNLFIGALKMAERGWPVFPCHPQKKTPATVNGLKDATTEWAKIIHWWSQRPDCNIGLCTGAESGLVVLDVDGEEGCASLRKLEQEYEELPRTWSVVTPSGGQHYYFQHPGGEFRNSAGKLGEGLDTRGDGGYVLAPPSEVKRRTYHTDERAPIALMPEWLQELVRAPRAEDGSQDQGEWLGILQGADEGQRNYAMARLAGYLLRRYVHLDVTREVCHLVNKHRFKPPLANWELDRTIESILDREIRRRSQEG